MRDAPTRRTRRRGRTVLELDALGERREAGVARLTDDVHDVGLLDPVARMGEPVGERPVVRQEEHARGVAVEPADRHDPDVSADEPDDRRAPLGSRAVAIVPRGLFSRTWRASACRRHARRPARHRSHERVQLAGRPLTVTRPALISSSAPRREATPARPRYAFRRTARAPLRSRSGRHVVETVRVSCRRTRLRTSCAHSSVPQTKPSLNAASSCSRRWGRRPGERVSSRARARSA